MADPESPGDKSLILGQTLEDAIQLHQQGDLAGATQIYRQLVDRAPGNADAWHLFGVAAHQQGAHQLGAELIANAIQLNAGVADYHSNLAMVQKSLGLLDEAEASLGAALARDPDHAKALGNLAGIKRGRGDIQAALDLARRAVAADPGDGETHNNLGNALKDMGHPGEAIASYRRALDIAPDFALAHWNLSLALLLTGDLRGGFREMSWRWRWSGFPSERRDFAQPVWDGTALEGRDILLHAEQGLGDAIHFVRYAPLVAELGGRVAIEVPGPLVPLVCGADLMAGTVIAKGDPLPDFQVHAPFLDLPRLLASDFGDLPDRVPYLAPQPALAVAWKDRLAEHAGFKLGLNWCGNGQNPVERFRRLPVGDLAPITAIAGLAAFSLQKGPGGAEVTPPAELGIIESGEAPLGETAAMIAGLDLVITSDTAIAHLAGALGRPCWLALHHAPDWRWLLERDDSPWYPSLRLFRQDSPGDWAGVIRRMAAALGQLVQAG